MRLIKNKTHIDFLGRSRRKIALGVSVFLVFVSIVSLVRNGLEFGIDFTGGILIEVGYEQAADLVSIRSHLTDAGYDDVQVQRFGADTDVLVRLPPQDGRDPDELREDLRRTVAAGTSGVDLRRVEFVSPQVGKELAEQGGFAMIIAHLTVVAAVLAVIGYSLNDTVVAFDRIRENFFKLRGITAEESMNTSINEMLARTIITGVTTLLVLVALLLLGGESIAPFSIALIVGIVVGTYSSIYTASATALLLGVNAQDLIEPVKDPDLIDESP